MIKSFQLAAYGLFAAVIGAGAAASAEVTAISGQVESEVVEIRGGVEADRDFAFDAFPLTVGLPLQVIARLVAADEGVDAAGAAAGQFADPRTLDQPNPEEFAANLAADGQDASIRYRARTVIDESREVVFSLADLGLGAEAGVATELTGRLFLDGALAIVGDQGGADLTDARVRVELAVEQVDSSGATEVFRGAVELIGRAGGTADVSAEGAFPTDQLIFVDLGAISGEFEHLIVLVIPNISIDYAFTAVADEPLTLNAKLSVEGVSGSVGGGAAAVLGTPVDTLQRVLTLTRGETSSAKIVEMIARQRQNPTGTPAFPESVFSPLLPACGLLGFEAPLLLGMLGVWSAGRRPGGRRGAGPVRRRG